MNEREYGVNPSSAGAAVQDGGEQVCCTPEYPILFSPEHELSKLRVVWMGVEAMGQGLRLYLNPGEPGGRPIYLTKPERDSRRIHVLLTHIAKVRVQQILAHTAAADEMAVVIPAEDEMAAWLFLLPPIGQGKQLNGSQINKLLQQRSIFYGVDWNVLNGLSQSQHRYFFLHPIAVGRAPRPGEDGQVLEHFPRELEENIQVEKLDQADYESLNLVRNIQKGDVICEIIPPTQGQKGRTVTGKAVPPLMGRAAQAPQGRNTCLSEDGTRLMAEQNGHLYFSGRSFHVKPVLDVYDDGEDEEERDVNIKFMGDVHIHGDLCEGAYVCAMGNVQIDGSMEGCNVEAGENIVVSSGVQGQDRAVLRAQKGVYAKYLERCTVYARESVQADCIINSSVYSDGTVRVRTGRGVIVGGSVRAAREVSAIAVGAKAERETQVFLGGRPCEEAERVAIQEEIHRLEQELDDVKHQRDVPGQSQQESRIKLSQYAAKRKLEKLNKEMEEPPAPHDGTDPCQLCCDTAYPGTAVTIGHNIYRVTQEETDCVIHERNGRVCKR